MPYSNAVISETLRKYPPLPLLVRENEQDYVILNTDKVIAKGTKVIIPMYSIQHDDKNFSNPECFNPERFFGDYIAKIRDGTYFPFGDGPRVCLGLRFAKMSMRTALADAILRYNFEPCSQTKYPLTYVNGPLLIIVNDGIFVKVTKRNIEV